MREFPEGAVVVDLETEAIQPHPHYPPKPCGVAIQWEDGKREYLAFGHASNNNCSHEEAQRALRLAFSHPVFFHNAAFDMEVARVHFGLPYPQEWHDTLFLAFLCDPHAPSLKLKDLAVQKLSGFQPAERAALGEWVVENLDVPANKAMLHMPKIPGDLVGNYAMMDVSITMRLARVLWVTMNNRDLWVSYGREKRLLPWLIDSERRGMRVDRELLDEWRGQLDKNILNSDASLVTTLGEANFDSNDEVADLLEQKGYVAPDAWPRTATGKRSVSLPAMHKLLPPALYNLIAFRNKSATMLRTFVGPWLERSQHDGRLHTGWSQTRSEYGNGTRTGRIASFNPNLANVPNKQKVDTPYGMFDLPVLRRALLPEEGHVWLSADYKQQELKLLAHYEDGDMMQAYLANPDLDLHQWVAELVRLRTGVVLDRKAAKILNFLMIYGGGYNKVAEQLEVPIEQARVIRDAYLNAMPGVRDLQVGTRRRFARQESVRTIGGRVYFVEPPREGRTFDYKGLNILIQGGAADQTKQAIIDYCSSTTASVFLGSVYDEVNVSVPADVESAQHCARLLSESMNNAMPMDVGSGVDLEIGPNWGDLTAMELT